MSENMLYRVIDTPDTFDRYTLCFMGPDGPFVYGASENPFHPLGFGQFCGDFYVSEDQDIGAEITRDELPPATLKLVEELEGD